MFLLIIAIILIALAVALGQALYAVQKKLDRDIEYARKLCFPPPPVPPARKRRDDQRQPTGDSE